MSQFDFSALDVSDGRTARFTFHSISLGGNTPYVTVRPATEDTPAYYKEVLKRVGKSARQVSEGVVNQAMVKEARDDDRRLYPLHVVKGWGYVDADGKDHPGVMPNKDGQDLKFSAEGAADFVSHLPTWVFDELRGFCGKPANFVSPEHVRLDGETAGKN